MQIQQAKTLVAKCEADLGYKLSVGQITDLLLDNWPYPPNWTNATAADECAQARALAEGIRKVIK